MLLAFGKGTAKIFLLVLSFFHEYLEGKLERKQNKVQCMVLIAVAAISSVYPLKQCGDVIATDHITELESDVGWTTLEDYASRVAPNIAVDVRYNYYSYDIENNLFYNYVAQSKDWELYYRLLMENAEN